MDDSKKLLILPYHVSNESSEGSSSTEEILEELIDLFSEFPLINTCSKSTSWYLHKNPLPSDKLKENYDIDFVIEGGIKIIEGKKEISTRLFNTKEDIILFQLKQPFNETELAAQLKSISADVYLKINARVDSSLKNKTPNKADEYYQKGLDHWKKYTYQELKEAIRYFKITLQHNENFALAYAALSDCYCVIGVMGFEEPKASFSLAKSFVQKALKLNNKPSEAFVSAALI